jgi:nucleotide-binding universal stress UspA family protein
MSATGFTSILVATDGSPTARAAVGRGLELARRSGASITLLHVVPPVAAHESRLAAFPLVERLPAEGDSILAEAGARAEDAGVEAETLVVSGDAPRAILAAAESVGADLVVVGRGRRRPKLRSVAKGVLHRADRPVLLVRGERRAA